MGSSSTQSRRTYQCHRKTLTRYQELHASSTSLSSTTSCESSCDGGNSYSAPNDSARIRSGPIIIATTSTATASIDTATNINATTTSTPVSAPSCGSGKRCRRRSFKGGNGGSKPFSSSNSRYTSCKWSRILIVALCQMASVLSQGRFLLIIPHYACN